MTTIDPARFLMCRPEHFAVSYTINPWMDPAELGARQRRAHAPRDARMERPASHAGRRSARRSSWCRRAPDLPDLVFTANAAVVLDRKALLARFRHPRASARGAAFRGRIPRAAGARPGRSRCASCRRTSCSKAPATACWTQTRKLFWMGYGPRSDAAARRPVEDMFGVEVCALELADQRFYHMDTALCPLPGGEVMYVPEAFTARGPRHHPRARRAGRAHRDRAR